eukprot:tig00000471_g1181.t1
MSYPELTTRDEVKGMVENVRDLIPWIRANTGAKRNGYVPPYNKLKPNLYLAMNAFGDSMDMRPAGPYRWGFGEYGIINVLKQLWMAFVSRKSMIPHLPEEIQRLIFEKWWTAERPLTTANEPYQPLEVFRNWVVDYFHIRDSYNRQMPRPLLPWQESLEENYTMPLEMLPPRWQEQYIREAEEKEAKRRRLE